MKQKSLREYLCNDTRNLAMILKASRLVNIESFANIARVDRNKLCIGHIKNWVTCSFIGIPLPTFTCPLFLQPTSLLEHLFVCLFAFSQSKYFPSFLCQKWVGKVLCESGMMAMARGIVSPAGECFKRIRF